MNLDYAIEQLKRGNINGLEWLVRNYQLPAFQAAFLIVQDEQLAEDVVQDAYLLVYRKIDQFDPSRPFEPWFFRVVMNLAVNMAKRQRKYSCLSDETTLDDVLDTTCALPEKQVEMSEFQDAIWEAMKNLSLHQRRVVVEHYFFQMTGNDIAARMGNAPGTVKWLLSTARKKHRSFLSKKSIKNES